MPMSDVASALQILILFETSDSWRITAPAEAREKLYSHLDDALAKMVDDRVVKPWPKAVPEKVEVHVSPDVPSGTSANIERSLPVLTGDIEDAIFGYTGQAIFGKKGSLSTQPAGSAGFDLSPLAQHIAKELKDKGWARITPRK